MMKTAQAGAPDDRCFWKRLLFDWSAIGCVFVETVVNAVFVKVADVVTDQASQMLFVQRDHVIEQLTPTVLPGGRWISVCSSGGWAQIRLPITSRLAFDFYGGQQDNWNADLVLGNEITGDEAQYRQSPCPRAAICNYRIRTSTGRTIRQAPIRTRI